MPTNTRTVNGARDLYFRGLKLRYFVALVNASGKVASLDLGDFRLALITRTVRGQSGRLLIDESETAIIKPSRLSEVWMAYSPRVGGLVAVCREDFDWLEEPQETGAHDER